MRKTKIICTIGPASEDVEIIKLMIENGMNVARLNFSHGVYEEHKRRIQNIRKAADDLGTSIAIMLDTKGPEIRTGKLRTSPVLLNRGQRFVLTSRDVPGDEQEVQVSYKSLSREVGKGTTILLADGLIGLLVEEVNDTDVICRVINGGELGERKGVNVPGVRINLPFMSDKDKEDIRFGIENEVDYIAASFVRTPEDVLEIRSLLEQKNADIDIIAKIESQQGVDNLKDIIKVADGVMVARGDLGVEIPVEEVPLVQKNIAEKCSLAGKMVIIATQMLDSMINNPRPTRAEVSDVANAIFDGADAIMLSGETAAGKYPVEAVKTMARIAKRAEDALPYSEILRQKRLQGTLSVTDAISYATCATAMSLDASAIIPITQTGSTAKMVAKYRPQVDIIAATPRAKVLNKLAMVWGVYPVLIPDVTTTDDLFNAAIKGALGANLIQNGDMIVLTAGFPTGFSGGTNMLKVHVVGDVLVEGVGIGSQAVKGKVKIVLSSRDMKKVQPGDIVVTKSADSSFAQLLDKISAIVAEEGGLTSDAAIMGLNSNIPVVVGAVGATDVLKDEMLVTIDTPQGKVYKGLAKVV
ncbi:MAG: pyruvate kinase [Syntrophomonadaceae bacterium]|nr:pyruvate kinase [Syntrophomonadaceae bacterium]